MIIERDRMKIELTSIELSDAHAEQEKIYSVQNIKDNMPYYLDQEYCGIARSNEDLVLKAAEILIKNQNHGMSYEEALQKVFKEIKKDMLEGQ